MFDNYLHYLTIQGSNIQDEASVILNRAKQVWKWLLNNIPSILILFKYTEEKLGKAERTQLDPHLVMLETKTDNMKNLTTKLKDNSAAVLVPNPGKTYKT